MCDYEFYNGGTLRLGPDGVVLWFAATQPYDAKTFVDLSNVLGKWPPEPVLLKGIKTVVVTMCVIESSVMERLPVSLVLIDSLIVVTQPVWKFQGPSLNMYNCGIDAKEGVQMQLPNCTELVAFKTSLMTVHTAYAPKLSYLLMITPKKENANRALLAVAKGEAKVIVKSIDDTLVGKTTARTIYHYSDSLKKDVYLFDRQPCKQDNDLLRKVHKSIEEYVKTFVVPFSFDLTSYEPLDRDW